MDRAEGGCRHRLPPSVFCYTCMTVAQVHSFALQRFHFKYILGMKYDTKVPMFQIHFDYKQITQVGSQIPEIP